MSDIDVRVMRMIDCAINYHRYQGRKVTGIIISTPLKKHLKNACYEMIGAEGDSKDFDVSKYMGIPIIETSKSESRCEVIWKHG